MKYVPDPLNDPPPTEEELRRREEVRAAKMCPECARVSWLGHFPWCSKADPLVRERYEARRRR